MLIFQEYDINGSWVYVHKLPQILIQHNEWWHKIHHFLLFSASHL